VGHALVGDDQADGLRVEQLQGFKAAGGRQDVVMLEESVLKGELFLRFLVEEEQPIFSHQGKQLGESTVSPLKCSALTGCYGSRVIIQGIFSRL
jgi:hypothetical protein